MYFSQLKKMTSTICTIEMYNATLIAPKPHMLQQRNFHNTTIVSNTPMSRISSPFSWIKGIGIKMRNIYRGDDHINPKKILERKYMYLTLLAIQFRNFRLAEIEKGNTQMNNDDLYEQAIDELDKKNLDKTTNVDLRMLLQEMLRPQLRQIFETFDAVDRRLAIPQSIESYKNTDENTTSIMDEYFFTTTFKDILINDFDRTQQQLSDCISAPTEDKKQSQIQFLTTKEQAILSLLQYHGWSRDTDAVMALPPLLARKSNDGADTTTPQLDPFGMQVDDTKDEATTRLLKQYQTINICRSSLIRDELGYSVLSLRSSIPNAGRGLFIDGSVFAGAIVAFQPGDVWPKEHMLTDAPEVMEHFADDDEDCQISLRFDDYVVDARQSPVVVLCRDGSLNPWALGNMVNHPNPTMIPNCQSVMLNYTAKSKLEHLARYIPNSYAKLPTWQSIFFDLEEVVMHGLCLVSRRDVENQEFLYDYRLQSDITPNWYNIVKYENQLEEDQVVFFRDDWRSKQ